MMRKNSKFQTQRGNSKKQLLSINYYKNNNLAKASLSNKMQDSQS